MSQKPFKILGIEHVGIAKHDLDGMSNLFSDILGIEHSSSEIVEDQHVKTEIFDTGQGKLEFLQATTSDSSISRFIAKKGEGMHHVALLVDNLQPALEYLKNNGMKLIDETPRIGAEGFSIAFLDPKSTGGILVELCEKKS